MTSFSRVVRSNRRRSLAIFFAGILVLSAIASWGLGSRFSLFFREVVQASEIRPSIGHEYVARIQDPSLGSKEYLSDVEVYALETKPGNSLHRFDLFCNFSFACSWLNALIDSNFPNATYQARIHLGPAVASEKDVQDKGGGLYTIQDETIRFSVPAGVAISRVGRIELVPEFSSLIERGDWAIRTGTILSAIRDISAFCFVLLLIVWMFGRGFAVAGGAIAPGLVITAVMLIVCAAGGELYFRYAGMFPKSDAIFPAQYVENVGFLFKPGAIIKHTNGTDYWATTEANSLGFADSEPVLPKPEDTFRVLLVGDSFIEGIQVPIAQKVQTLLAGDLKKNFPDRKSDVIGLGFSGTGQSNQLPFYERNRADFKPDLVVLVFVANDFANNSDLLESIRYGWDPGHPPRLYFRPKPDGSCDRLPMDSNWSKFLVPGSTISQHANYFRKLSPDFDVALGNWNPEKESIDDVFWKEGILPPAFEDAVTATKCSFAEWKKIAQSDGFWLLVVATEGVAHPNSIGRGQIIRLTQILRDLDIPFVDLYPYVMKQPNPETSHWKSDVHWAPNGHRWAADVILNYIKEHHMLARDH